MKHMKHIYRIGYYDEECSDGWELWHEKKLTEEELSDLVAKAIIAVVESEMDSIVDFVYVGSFGDSTVDVEDVMAIKDDEFLEELKKLGFTPLDYTAIWSVHGSSGLLEPRGFEYPKDFAESYELRKKIPKELKDRVMAKIQEKKEARERRKEMSETQKKIEVKE